MAVKIVTDSTCDLSNKLVQDYDIEVVPLIVNFGDKAYRDGVDITSEDFFKLLSATKELPFTSQVNPAQFETVFRRLLDAGDEIVGIFISSTFSGTYGSAVIAKELFTEEERKKIHLYDSRISTVPLGLVAIEGAKVAKNSGDVNLVCKQVEYAIANVKIICVLDTLLYLSKGGRISPGQAIVGNLLNIKPVLTVDEKAEIVKIDKVRGRNKGIRWIVDYIEENSIDINGKPFALIHGDDLESVKLLKEQLGDSYVEKKDYDLCIGAVIGTHLGPGTVGIAYIE